MKYNEILYCTIIIDFNLFTLKIIKYLNIKINNMDIIYYSIRYFNWLHYIL